MSPIRARIASLAVVGAALSALSLSGCITLLPKTPPSQLYRFGATPAAPRAPSAGGRVPVLLETVGMPRASSSDGILTTTGSQAAFIAQARWVSPAVILFAEATQRAFDERAGRVRLSGRGSLGRIQASLRLNVRDFQAEYPAPGAAPSVNVTLHARLTRADGRIIDERDFSARKLAADNRVGEIVPAYDAAVTDVLSQVVAWSDAAAGGLTAG